MKKIAIALLIGLGITTTSCFEATPAPNELKIVSFEPTQCSEPWDAAPYTDTQGANRGSRILAYLKDKGITSVYNFSSKSKGGGAICQACTCLSGEEFSFGLSEADYLRLKSIPPFTTYLP